jgi:anti-sigma B factor antagonist
MRRSWQFENPAGGGSDGRAAGRFRVDIVPDRDVVRVAPVGELDMSSAGELATEMQELRRSGFARLVLDLRGATFIDSTGLHVILDEYDAAKADGGDLTILPGPPAVQRVFHVTGLDSLLPFLDGANGKYAVMPGRPRR